MFWYLSVSGVYNEYGLVHSVETRSAMVHDLTPVVELLRGEETVEKGCPDFRQLCKKP